jgi:hypothetical protein
VLGADFAHTVQPPVSGWSTREEFLQQLELPVEIHWHDAILQESLQRLAAAQRVAIVLDRRIDPHQRITASVSPTKFIDAIQSVCDTRGWGVSVLSPVIYIGPSETTRPLASWQRQQRMVIEQLPGEQRRRWERTTPCAWPEVTEPRALLTEWLSAARIPADGLDQIAYDLWPAQNLPALDVLQRLVITLAGFQLGPEVKADGSVAVVRLPREIKLTHHYVVPARRLAAVGDLQTALPDAKLTLRQRRLEVVGRAEDHDYVQLWLEGRPRRAASVGALVDKRFTLTVQNQPIAAILQAVAGQLDLELVWDDATQSWREDRVSLSVKNATLGELLAAVLHGQAATYRVRGRKLLIMSAEAAGNNRREGARP